MLVLVELAFCICALVFLFRMMDSANFLPLDQCLPLIPLEKGVPEHQNRVGGLLLVEIVQMELADEARKFAEAEVYGYNFSIHFELVLNQDPLPVAIPADHTVVLIILHWPIGTSKIPNSLRKNLLILFSGISRRIF